MTEISLSAAQRNNLLSLRDTQILSDRTNIRLASGKRVNSVADDAVNFFRSRSLNDRADDFGIRQDNIVQGIESLNSILTAVDAIDNLLKQARGITESTRSQQTSERQASTRQLAQIFRQLSNLTEDASYQGLNLINTTNAELVIFFGTRAESSLTVNGLNLNATDGAIGVNDSHLFTEEAIFANNSVLIFSHIFTATSNDPANDPRTFTRIGANNSYIADIDRSINRIDNAIAKLRSHAAVVGSNSSILSTRQTFTRDYINSLRTGADALVLADLNEEAATSVVLQTRQQLGINALRLAGQQIQAIVSLLQ